MSTLYRTIKNFMQIGPRLAGRQMQYMGDTKAGTLIGTDKYGNKYYENLEDELPLRTRWIDYKDNQFDPSQITPGWHAWMSYMTHLAPPQDPIAQMNVREWELKEHRPNLTASRSAYKPYSTVKSKMSAWSPKVEQRS